MTTETEKTYRPLTQQEATKAMHAGRLVSLGPGDDYKLDMPGEKGVTLVAVDGRSFTAFFYETLMNVGVWSDTNEPCGIET